MFKPLSITRQINSDLFTNIPVFYDELMSVSVDSISPSSGKPSEVVQDWSRCKFPLAFKAARPVSVEDLCLAHDPKYVKGIMEGRVRNGFDNKDIAIAQSTLYTVGAMVGAAREALVNDVVAVAPVSGFHHAHHASNHGFCTFNGLMVAALVLKQAGLVSRIGILDLDQHYGDGTADIIETLKLDWVTHYTAGLHHREPEDAPRFLLDLPKIVETFDGCELLLYQAGADPHVADPLGGWMTTKQLSTRDRMVFEHACEMRLPVAWNLAGGYQRDRRGGIEPVLEIHRNTMAACVDTFIEVDEA